MKKFKTILFVAFLAASANSFAQFSNSSSSSSVSSDGWNTIYFQWNPSQFSPDKGDSQSFTGLSLGYSHAFPVSNSIPLLIETGIGLQYSFYKEDIAEELDFDSYYDYDYSVNQKVNMFSAKVPVHLLYDWQIPNSSVSIIPFAGLNMRFNISGKSKVEYGKDLKDDYDLEDEDINLFDKKEMGGDPWKRFQIGWELGVKAKFNNKFLVGVSYGQDFSEIAKKVKIHTTSITLGYCF